MSGSVDPFDLRNAEDEAASQAWRQLIEEDEGWKAELRERPMRLSHPHLEAIHKTVRGTLEDAGIPWGRANELASRVRTALKEL